MVTSLTELRVFFLAAGAVMALFSLLAMWVAVAKRPHWLVRSVLLLAAIALLLPIDAHDVAVYCLYQSGLIIGTMLAVHVGWPWFRRILGRRSAETGSPDDRLRPQVALKDLFFVTTLISGVAAILTAAAAQFPVSDWSQLHRPVLLTTLIALTAVLAVGTQGKLWWRVVCGAIFVASTTAVCWDVSDPFTGGFSELGPYGHRSTFEGWAVLAYAVTIITVSLLSRVDRFASIWRQSDSPESDSRLRRILTKISRLARPVLILLGLLIVFPLVYAYWKMAFLPDIPPSRTGEPNRYKELLSISSRFENIAIPDEDGGDVGLAAFAKTHATVVEEVRGLLARPSFVPLSYTEEDYERLNFNLFHLARANQALGRDAEKRGQTQEAMDIYWDSMRIGRAMMAGGLRIDRLYGLTGIGLGQASLRKMRHKLTTQQRHELIRKLDSFDESIEPLDDILARDKIWNMNVYGWRNRFLLVVREWAGLEPDYADSFQDPRDRPIAICRMLITTMALSIYREEHADLPESLDQLLPKYMPRVYDDPFGSGSFVYRRQDEQRFVLYSLGENQIDDDGTVGYSDEGEAILIEDASRDPQLKDLYIDPDDNDFFLDLEDWQNDVYEEEDWEKDAIDEENGEESEDSP